MKAIWNGKMSKNGAWMYPEPTKPVQKVKGHFVSRQGVGVTE